MSYPKSFSLLSASTSDGLADKERQLVFFKCRAMVLLFLCMYRGPLREGVGLGPAICHAGPVVPEACPCNNAYGSWLGACVRACVCVCVCALALFLFTKSLNLLVTSSHLISIHLMHSHMHAPYCSSTQAHMQLLLTTTEVLESFMHTVSKRTVLSQDGMMLTSMQPVVSADHAHLPDILQTCMSSEVRGSH